MPDHFALSKVEPNRPDHYLALLGLTWLSGGTLAFTGGDQDHPLDYVPVLAIADTSSAREAAIRVVDRARQLMIGISPGEPDVPVVFSGSHIVALSESELTAKIAAAQRKLDEEPTATAKKAHTSASNALKKFVGNNTPVQASIDKAWGLPPSEPDWSLLSSLPNRTSNGNKYGCHLLTFQYRVGVTGYSAAWDSADAASYAGVTPEVTEKKDQLAWAEWREQLPAWYATQVESILLGEAWESGADRDKSIGRFSPDEGDADGTSDVSGRKFIDPTVEMLALAAYPMVLPWFGKGKLRWHLNTRPATSAALAALQRLDSIPGMVTFETPIRSANGNGGYSKFGHSETAVPSKPQHRAIHHER